MVALSRGTVLVSGSGVLMVGDVGTGLGATRGFLYIQKHTQTFYSTCLITLSLQVHIISSKMFLYGMLQHKRKKVHHSGVFEVIALNSLWYLAPAEYSIVTEQKLIFL